LRLLIDEMYPPAIAAQLRRRGHDAVAVTERPELRSATDDSVFAIAQQEGRAVVTENVADFVPLADAADQLGAAHHGLVLVDPSKYPRGLHRTIGRMVRALDRILNDCPGAEPTGTRQWL
jgi:predicted nuclease of predicted toxin-antitoxin system